MSLFYLKNVLVSTVCLSAAYFVPAVLHSQHKLADCTLLEYTRPGLLRKAGSRQSRGPSNFAVIMGCSQVWFSG